MLLECRKSNQRALVSGRYVIAIVILYDFYNYQKWEFLSTYNVTTQWVVCYLPESDSSSIGKHSGSIGMSEVDQPLFSMWSLSSSLFCCLTPYLYISRSNSLSDELAHTKNNSRSSTKKQQEYPWMTSYEFKWYKHMTVKQKIMSSQNISCLIDCHFRRRSNNQPNYEKLAPLRSVPSVPNVWHLPPCEGSSRGLFSPKRINRRHWTL